MSNFRRRLHSIRAFLAFVFPFLLIFPLFLIFLQRKEWSKLAFRIHHWWSKAFFFLSGLSIEIDYREDLDPKGRYIICPNHFSYLDIPTTVRNKYIFAFMGKDDMAKIPLFGYMYKRMHILVDRESIKSSYKAKVEAGKALDDGRSILIFPEGGILTKDPPNMVRFKDGAFRIAIEKQVPIIPVTIPHNWIILPDDEKFLVDRSLKVKMIFHESIDPSGMTLDDVGQLKERTYKIIESELKKQNLGNGNK